LNDQASGQGIASKLLSWFNLAASNQAPDIRSLPLPFLPAQWGREMGKRGNSWVEAKTI